MKNTRLLLQFALLFSVLIVTTRCMILLWSSPHLTSEYGKALLVGAVNEFTLGLLIAAGVFSDKLYVTRITCFFIIPLVVIAQLACFHYESVFGRLPDAEVLFYLTQLSHLVSSLNKDFPVYLVLFEFIVLLGILYFGLYQLKLRKTERPLPYLYQFIALVSVVISILLQVFPASVPSKYFWGSREALVWLAQSQFIKETYELNDIHLSRQDFTEFLNFHGNTNPTPHFDPDYPLCRDDITTAVTSEKLKRNIILLVLEGIGNAEMGGEFNDVILMPNLQKIAAENLYFRHVFAPGTKSIQTLPAIFSGLPANPHNNYLWRKLLLDFDGFPNRLKEANYRTAYLHGGDLSFEFQRSYLKQVGFTEIIEYDQDKDHEVYGWGYPDDVMLQELRAWIDTHKKEKGKQPYLASLFTLSTHHPYILPDEWQPVFSEEQLIKKDKLGWHHYKKIAQMKRPFAETQKFLDHHLGQFYQWYLANEKDAILIITSDHAFNLFNRDDVFDERFDVPLIIAGLSNDERQYYADYQDRVGGLNDLPEIIMGLLGMSGHECDLGVNLLSPNYNKKDERYVYAMGGGAYERMHIWTQDSEVLYDRLRDSLQQRDYPFEGEFKDMVKGPEKNKVISFINNILPVHYYMLNKNAYYMPPKSGLGQALPSQIAAPFFVAHRGNISGEDSSLPENSRAALDAVIASGYKWAEVDIQMTRDGEFVVMHDFYIDINGERFNVNKMTLAELYDLNGQESIFTLKELIADYSEDLNLLIEIKSGEQILAFEFLHTIREVAGIIKERKSNNKIIVDSFDEEVAISMKNQCKCEVGFDTPYKIPVSEQALRNIKLSGIDWVYVEHSVVDAELIDAAHRLGLKVMAYTVNSKEVISQWWQNGIFPDGVITDDMRIID